MGEGAAAEDFEGIVQSGSYLSRQQTTDLFPHLASFNGLPFDASYATYFAVAGTKLAQFVLINSAGDAAYNFTQLTFYTGIDTRFFNDAAFASPGAIASAATVLDVLATTGTTGVTANRPDLLPYLTLTAPVAAPNTFELLVGRARSVDQSGNFGPPVDFAIASRAVPEPAIVFMLLGGVFAPILQRLRRRRPRRSSSERAEATR